MSDLREKLQKGVTKPSESVKAIRKSQVQTVTKSLQNEFEILSELRDLIIPLSEEEFSLLKEDIKVNGVNDPLLIWHDQENNRRVLIDGHNRYQIAQDLGVDFSIKEISADLTSLEEVKDFMIDHQFARRNLTEAQKSYYRGLRYLRTEKQQGKRNDIEEETSGKIYPKLRLSEKIAQEYGVGEKTIRNDANYAKGLEILDPILKREVLTGKEKLSKGVLTKLANYDPGKKILNSTERVVRFVEENNKAFREQKAKQREAQLQKKKEELKDRQLRKEALYNQIGQNVRNLLKSYGESPEDIQVFIKKIINSK
jgi:ParB-like chromosome segregation protein Spo0J